MLAKNQKVTLDLGLVSVSAKVKINGIDVGVAWLQPYQLDVTSVLKTGENTLEIEVANQWRNRLIGDESLPDTSGYIPTNYSPSPEDKMPQWYIDNKPMPKSQRKTFVTRTFVTKDDPLESSGLIGPVRLIPTVIHQIEK